MLASRHVKEEYSESALSVQTSRPQQAAQPRPSNMPPDKICFSRRREGNQARKGRGFLGCITEPVALSKCCTCVSDRYTITGYQDQDQNYGLKIEVNGKFLLSLEPKAVGRVLGMDIDGLRVPLVLSPGQKREMLNSISDGKRPAVECLVSKGGVNLNSLKPDLRQHILKRAREVFVDTARSEETNRGLGQRYVYCMTRELFYHEKYDWAECALGAIRAKLRRHHQLNLPARTMLTTCFDAAFSMPAVSKSDWGLEKVLEAASGHEGRERRQKPNYESEQGIRFKRETEEQGDVQIQMVRRSKRLKLEFPKPESDHEASLLLSAPASNEIIHDRRLGRDVDSRGVGDLESMYVKAWRTVKKRLKDLMRLLS